MITIESIGPNLLTANQSDVEADLTGLSGAGTATRVKDTTEYYTGHASAKATCTGAGTISISTNGAQSPVTAGMEYRAAAYCKAQAAAGRKWQFSIYWFNSGGGTISTTDTAESDPTADFSRLTISGIAPAGAVSACIRVSLNNAQAGEILWFDCASLKRITRKAYLDPVSDAVTASIDNQVNGPCTLALTLPRTSDKWQYITDANQLVVDGKRFTLVKPGEDTVESVREDGKIEDRVNAHESWILLQKIYPSVDSAGGTPDFGIVSILQDDPGCSGFTAGSADSALAYLTQGTGWKVIEGGVTGTHDLETEKLSLLGNIQQVQELWGGLLVWNSEDQTVCLKPETWQPYKGFQIRYAKNQKDIARRTEYDLVTKLYPFGSNGLDISDVEPSGNLYLTNYTYATETYVGTWETQDIDEPDELMTKATEKLTYLSSPRYRYQVDTLDLRTLVGYEHETFTLGDMADILDVDADFDFRVRIIRHKYDVFQPWNCELELGELSTTLQKMLAGVIGNQPELLRGLSNFDSRNDRIKTTPADPVIANDGTAIDHTINTDGSCDISFEWSFAGTGEAYDIDGFVVLIHQSSSSSAYTFGTDPSSEQQMVLTSDQRGCILYGVAANRYYTFGVQAYRIVDKDIDASGIKSSALVKSIYATENPYQPSTNVSFTGNIHDTLHPADIAVGTLDGFGDAQLGDVTISADTTFTVDDEDVSMIIKQYKSLTINAGVTVTVDKRCRGLFIYCAGNFTLGGTINMNGKAAKVLKANSVQKTLQVPVGVCALEIPAGSDGGAGGAGGRGYGGGDGGSGGSSTAGMWFGGGAGGAGGGGGGGGDTWNEDGGPGGNAGSSDIEAAIGSGGTGGATSAATGGAGGNLSGGGGGAGNFHTSASGGGGGGGAGFNYGTGGASSTGGVAGSNGSAASAYGGGLVVIVARGDITINAGGLISANGIAGANGGAGGRGNSGNASGGGGGGGSGGAGGGVVVLAYRGTCTNNGSVIVNGGTKGNGGAGGSYSGSGGQGSAGGNGTNGTVGTITTMQV